MAIDLNKIDTTPPKSVNKKKTKEETQKLLEKIYEYQRIMYAQGKYSILLIFQGMDASGKDWAVREVFSWVNPLWCDVVWFRAPTKEEKAHDFLWRIHKHTPEKWMIQIFNRSQYEDILVPTVEGYLDKKTIDERYDLINNFENLLKSNNTHVIKCYLHTSKEEQKTRLEERLHLPHKFWKHNDNDRESREKWDDYRKVYHDIFKKCDKPEWNIVPADKNRWKVHCVAQILVDTFEKMDLQRPELDTEKFA